jgi:hypothetical protein
MSGQILIVDEHGIASHLSCEFLLLTIMNLCGAA